MLLDLPLLGRWLTGWSLARGLPLPQLVGGGFVVEVGWPAQVRRYVFGEAAEALQACMARRHAPYTYVKAAVEPAQLQRLLPPGWHLDQPRYLMSAPAVLAPSVPLPPGYVVQVATEHGAAVHRVLDATGQVAASGRVVLHQGTAVVDRLETQPAHRRQGLATYLMGTLEAVVAEAGIAERLLVATEAGCPLYKRLGWRVLAPYSTAVLLPAS
ncbi:GNAT family N-acetyltransferase [Hymenobacter sp. HMF4947]|uniref:GNAT family N-acetyltransferase n=1 Tax=Hymenobacter ginkgonis TaxID=2682976 RepID=A0A7K1TLK5_9BACT|nr:GNAT family N-acetyltransferase [Hymenobacter ginkgonis]MVN79285.1 GNAT family N-acetyltransferase [Hymenobacter ginkgonis]